MTPEEATGAGKGNIKMIPIKFLSHFAQLCHKSKERYEGGYEIPLCDEWFALPTNEYNPGLAYASMGICLSGYKNLPSNEFKYILGSFGAIGMEDIDITSYYHLNDENYIAALDDVNKISYAIGHRKIDGPEGPQELVVAMMRGTSVSVEWNSNSNVANSVADGDYESVTVHEGFWLSAADAYAGMKKYIAKHGIDPASARLWIVGHSRGATIANDVAAMFNEDDFGFPKEHVYSYNFATSTTTCRPDAQGPAFDNIFNVMNPEDWIPRIPPRQWNYVRFGRDLFLPSICTDYVNYRRYRPQLLKMFKEWTRVDLPQFHGFAPTNGFEHIVFNISDSCANMYQSKRYTQDGTITFAQYFRIFTDLAGQQGLSAHIPDGEQLAKYGRSVFSEFLGFFMHNEILGFDAPGAHQEEGYLIKLMLCYEMGIDIARPDGYGPQECDTRRFTVYGPADLIVRNAEGRVVAQIDRGKVQESLYDSDDFVAMYYDKYVDGSSVWIPDEGPDGETYSVEIIAHESRPYDITIARQTPLGAVVEQELYADVALEKGARNFWDDMVLKPTHVVKGDGLRADVEVRGRGKLPEGTAWTAEFPVGACIMPLPKPDVVADVLSARDAAYGDHVAVHAYCDRKARFLGWYEDGASPDDGEPLCKDETYVFRIEADRKLVAWFEEK